VVAHHLHRCGQSTALATGIRAAQNELIVTLDGDRQNDPADIPKLLASAQGLTETERPFLINGRRIGRQDSFVRKASSRIANRVRGALLRDQTPDTGCGLKLFRRRDFLQLPYFDHMHRFLPALFQRLGGTVVSVDVSHRPRVSGKSKYGINNRLWTGIIDLFGVAWLLRRSKLPEVEIFK
jgi:dolichol-phosphate mannosyltransferase